MLDRRALWFELSLFLFLTACQLEVRRDSGNDDAAHQDAGSEDAGSEDAGSEDAGSEDAGSEDAGSEDAGIGFDCESISSEAQCMSTSGCIPLFGDYFRDGGNGQVIHSRRKYAGCVKYACGAIFVCAVDPNDPESCWWFPNTCIPSTWNKRDCGTGLCLSPSSP
jgi:hypothetical protein